MELPDVLCTIITQYSCYSFCKNCNTPLFVENLILCGKCNETFCLNCAKRNVRIKWHDCILTPKCICCKCQDNESIHLTELTNICMKNNYKFGKWFDTERKLLLPILEYINKIVENM